jgi:hypothetical protein
MPSAATRRRQFTMPVLAISMLFASTLAVTTGVATAKQKPYVPTPGYLCTVGKAFNDEVWLTRRIDERGVQHDAHMDWKPRLGDIWQPRVIGLWGSINDRPLDIDSGSLFIEWGIKEDIFPRRSSPLKLSIELATRVRSQLWPRTPFHQPWRRNGSRTIETNWTDLRAYSKGADQLFVVLRDRRGKVFRQAELSPSVFAAGEKAIIEAMARMAAMSADYQKQCEHVTDISDGDIVLT